MEVPASLTVERGLWAGDVAVPLPVRPDGEGPTRFECPGCFFNPEWRSHQAVRIVHPDSLQEMPDGTVGEIWVAGGSVASGYWDLPEVSAATFGARLASSEGEGAPPDDAPHMRSGDLGFVWESRLYVVGRIKDVLTMRGRTLHAHDIEGHAERGSAQLRPGCCAAFSTQPPEEEGEVMTRMVWPAELARHRLYCTHASTHTHHAAHTTPTAHHSDHR
jgi:acyl-CoA synthetase (AMP-forming)/AMP-acid ligase II